MNAQQRRTIEDLADAVIQLTGRRLEAGIAAIQNPLVLRRVASLEREMAGTGKPRKAVLRLVERTLAELKASRLRTCRVCGCTSEQGCVGGCCWVAADLCSQCG